MSEFSNESNLIEIRSAHAENAMRAGGVLNEIARQAVTGHQELTPKDVANIIFPPKQADQEYQPRYLLVENAPAAVATAAAEQQERILELAESVDLLKTESLPQVELSRIDSEHALWIVEGGANRTGVVRRYLIIEAMQNVYGPDLSKHVVYQLGSDRPITKTRMVDVKDSETGLVTKEEKANAEYGVAQEIAAGFLPEGDTLTEFGLNLASAQQDGWTIVSDRIDDSHEVTRRVAQIRKVGMPLVVLVQPVNKGQGLKDGFNAVVDVANPYEGIQPVISTNGQYRAKDELQAQTWATETGVNILPPVAIGDEPGYTAHHAGKDIVTGPRGPMVYVNDAVILHKLS